jgi:hypothetical protein
MIDNLRATTERNEEQDWLKTNLAKFTRMLQGQRELVTVGGNAAERTGAARRRQQQGAIYQVKRAEPGDPIQEKPSLVLLAGYAQGSRQPMFLQFGEGLVGQCALDKQRILL